jgi:acyl-CoA thioester hydrolase
VITDLRPPFRFVHRTRVGFDETDAQGVVYYGRYMPYFDRARVEYLRHLGLLHGADDGREFVMRANRVSYEAPARFDDLLEVFVRVERIGTSSITYQFAAANERGELLVTAEQILVQIERATRRPVAIGEGHRGAIDLFEQRAVAAPGRDRRSGTVAAVTRIIEQDSEADEILRDAVAAIANRFDAFCGIRFVEEGALVDGPSAGTPPPEPVSVPIAYDGAKVAELVLGGPLTADDRATLEGVAALLGPFCLVGWDTGGEAWNP